MDLLATTASPIVAPPDNNYDDDGFVEDYILGNPKVYVKQFNPTSIIANFVKLPRFSHSDDISLLFIDKTDPAQNIETESYVRGLLFVGCFITSFFVFWCICLLILKWCGPRRVGMYAGFPYKKESWKGGSIFGRIALSFSSLMVIICTIILVTKGFAELQYVTDTIALTNRDVKLMSSEILDVVDNMRTVSKQAMPIRDELVEFLDNDDVCPNRPNSMTESTIRTLGKDTYTALTELDDFIDTYLKDVLTTVKVTEKTTTKVDTIVARVQFQSTQVISTIILPYFIVPAFLLVAVFMGYYDVFNETFYTVITWIILPCMVLLTLIAIVGSGWMAIAIEGNADFCAPSPETNIYNIMTRAYPNATSILRNAATSTDTSLEPNGASGTGAELEEYAQNNNFYYEIILFYTNQCDNTRFNNPWFFLENHYDALEKGKKVLGIFLQSIDGITLEQLSQECGVEYEPIVELLEQLQDSINVLSTTSIRALNLMSCQNIVPLYTNAIYDTTCTYSIIGATWIFACTVAIAFFGIVCIMFRGAYYPIGYYYYDSGSIRDGRDDDDDEKSFYGTSEDNSDGDRNENYNNDNENEEYNDELRPDSAEIVFVTDSFNIPVGDGDVAEDGDGVDHSNTAIDDLLLDEDEEEDIDTNLSCIEVGMMDAIDVDVYDNGKGNDNSTTSR